MTRIEAPGKVLGKKLDERSNAIYSPLVLKIKNFEKNLRKIFSFHNAINSEPNWRKEKIREKEEKKICKSFLVESKILKKKKKINF